MILGGLAVVVVVGMLTPVVAASVQPRTVTVFRAPYGGYPLTASTVSLIGCGAKASMPHLPGFATSTGRAAVVEVATASVCGSPHTFSRGAVNTSEGLFGGNWTVSASGKHHMVVHWSLTWTANLTANAGNLTQLAIAQDSIEVFADVSDATTGALFPSSNHWSQSNSTAHGSLNWSEKGVKVTLYVNGTLQTGHTYYFLTFVTVNVAAFVSQPGWSVASARVNLASNGNHATLLSMTVS